MCLWYCNKDIYNALFAGILCRFLDAWSGCQASTPSWFQTIIDSDRAGWSQCFVETSLESTPWKYRIMYCIYSSRFSFQSRFCLINQSIQSSPLSLHLQPYETDHTNVDPAEREREMKALWGHSTINDTQSKKQKKNTQESLCLNAGCQAEAKWAMFTDCTGLLLKVLPGKAADRSIRKAEPLPFQC